MGLIQKQKKNYSLKCFKLLFKLKSNKALKAHSCLLKKKKKLAQNFLVLSISKTSLNRNM